MHEPPEHSLPLALQDIVAEEKRLAENVRTALEAAARRKPAGQSPREQFLELREDAVEASTADLPALVDQMYAVRFRAQALGGQYLPNAQEPYFAHMRVETDGRTRDILLGHGTFIDRDHDVTIIDWRNAPVARVFFTYRQGEDYEEEFGERSVTGKVLCRRVLSFVDGELSYVACPEGAIRRGNGGNWETEEESLLPVLKGGQGGRLADQIIGVGASGKKMPVVSALLDPEQYEALSVEDAEATLVVGGAGCGKTTVAMHRLAAWSYRNRNRPNPKTMSVIVPEEGLRRLSSVLLDELGMGRVRAYTFERWIYNQARRMLKGLPKKECTDPPSNVTRFKRHPAFRMVLAGYMERLGEEIAKRLGRKLFMLENVEQFFMECPGPTLLDRLNQTETHFVGKVAPNLVRPVRKAVADERHELLQANEDRLQVLGDRTLLEKAVELSGGELRSSMIDGLLAHTRRQFDETDEKKYAHVDRERREGVDGRSLDAGTPYEVADTVDPEDYAILLELLKLKTGQDLGPGGRLKTYRHLVVDEAQDLAEVELSVLGRALRPQGVLTAAGDEAQHIDNMSFFTSWDRSMAALGVASPRVIRLTTTYRCTEAIARFGHAVLGPQAPVQPLRAPKKGVPVTHSVFDNEGNRAIFLNEALSELLDREPQADVAVIARKRATAVQLYNSLKEALPARLVLDGGFRFVPGIDCTEVTQVKGLEFDYVVIPDANVFEYPDGPEARRMLHVAATRAIHQLWVISVKNPSPLIPTDVDFVLNRRPAG